MSHPIVGCRGYSWHMSLPYPPPPKGPNSFVLTYNVYDIKPHWSCPPPPTLLGWHPCPWYGKYWIPHCIQIKAEFHRYFIFFRHGHANLAFKMSRIDTPLSPDKTIELGHHILKAHIYKNVSKQRGYSSRDMQAYWMAISSECLSSALVAQHNLYTPNIKVGFYRICFVNCIPFSWSFVKERPYLADSPDPEKTDFCKCTHLLCKCVRKTFPAWEILVITLIHRPFHFLDSASIKIAM